MAIDAVPDDLDALRALVSKLSSERDAAIAESRRLTEQNDQLRHLLKLGCISSGKPVPSKFQLKLLAGKRTDEVGIVFAGNRAKETVLPTSVAPSAEYVPRRGGA